MTLYAQWQINNYNVTYKDVVDSTSGTVLGQNTVSKEYGSTVKGSDLGSSTADNAYYNGYYIWECNQYCPSIKSILDYLPLLQGKYACYVKYRYQQVKRGYYKKEKPCLWQKVF